MSRRKNVTRILIVCCSLVAALPLALTAAPTFPVRENIPDELRCLQGIDSVSLDVRVPKTVQSLGVNAEKLRKFIVKKLQEADMSVVDRNPEVPHIEATITTSRSPETTDVVAVVVTLEVKQRVMILRINGRPLTLPTTTFVAVAVARKEDVGRAAERQCRDSTDHLLQTMNRAIAESR